jgi:hypothetical protein
MRVGGQLHAPATLPPGKIPGTHCIGGWVGPRAGLDGCEKSRPHWIRSPDRPARSVVAIPTTLSRPTARNKDQWKFLVHVEIQNSCSKIENFWIS